MKYLFLLLLFSCAQSSDIDRLNERIDSINSRTVTLENNAAWSNSRLDKLEANTDTLNRAVAYVGTLVIKHDSVIANGKTGMERAQRRGRFWGELVKTILR